MRLARYIGLAVLALILSLALALYVALRGSLPRIDGELKLADLRAPVTVERDAQGVPTIRAANRHDLALATGFVHAQDRFFQMDLLRRAGAGELAELLGAVVLDVDRARRAHEFRRIARLVLQRATPEQRDLLIAYASGVNQAMSAWSTRPWEYLVLRAEPRRWMPEDSLLTAYAMYFDLNDSTGDADYANAKMRDAMPSQLYAFMNPLGTEWDAPIDGGKTRLPPMPGPEVVDLRRGQARSAVLTAPKFFAVGADDERSMVGSNSWAVAGAQTRDGRALLANDMHLGLRVPHIWYRAHLIVEGERDLAGVTLPGMPLLVVGSNRHVAWGFTNSYGDWTDLVVVEPDPQDSTKYLTPQGSEPFEVHSDVISVHDRKPVGISTKWTRWGPVLRHDEAGRDLVVAWTAHDPSATNLSLIDLERAVDVPTALDVANRSGIAAQNFIVADSAGHIGWTVVGQVPIRTGYDSRFPSSWRSANVGWTGWRTPAEYPRVVDPSSGRLWSANARTINSDTWLSFLGDGGYDLGARAAQIRDDLLAHDALTAQDLAEIQTDDRSLFLTRWRDLLLEVLQPETLPGHPLRTQARELVEKWKGHAAVDDAGYRIVRAFRGAVRDGEFSALTAQARLRNPQRHFEPSEQFEAPLWQLVTQRPRHLLDPHYQDWPSALLAWFDSAAERLQHECGDLRSCTWGKRNTLAMRHPLSSALPFLSHWIDMPAEPLPGDSNMPRAQGPSFGASERLVVSPGREAQGLFSMPGGQSGHPLSPFYAAGHEIWARGKTEPLLPGPARHTLKLSAVFLPPAP